MPKIPLEQTISGAFRFFFVRILSVLGTVWLPLLAIAVLWGGLIWLVVPHDWWLGKFPVLQGKHPDPAAVFSIILPFFAVLPLLVLSAMVVDAMMSVGLLRLSLGVKKRCFIFFSLGADVWRVVWANVLIFVTLFAAEIAIVLFVIFATGLGTLFKQYEGLWTAGIVVLTIAAICFAIYSLVRLFFFLPAMVVLNHKIAFANSWRLGRGNFWRIVLISLVICIAVSIVFGTISDVTLVAIAGGLADGLGEHPTHAQIMAFFRALIPLAPIMFAIMALEWVANTAIMAGAVGTAYKALTGKEEAKS